MTSDIGVEPQFLFHCPCGTTIETSKEKETCTACGRTVEVRRRLATSHGTKYTLRVSNHRQRWDNEPRQWDGSSTPNATAIRARRRQRDLPEYGPPVSKPWLIVTLAVLLLLICCGLYFLTYQDWIAFNSGMSPNQIIVANEPRDCDWTSPPLGSKHCHYESSVNHVRDRNNGKHITVEWRRVNE